MKAELLSGDSDVARGSADGAVERERGRDFGNSISKELELGRKESGKGAAGGSERRREVDFCEQRYLMETSRSEGSSREGISGGEGPLPANPEGRESGEGGLFEKHGGECDGVEGESKFHFHDMNLVLRELPAKEQSLTDEREKAEIEVYEGGEELEWVVEELDSDGEDDQWSAKTGGASDEEEAEEEEEEEEEEGEWEVNDLEEDSEGEDEAEGEGEGEKQGGPPLQIISSAMRRRRLAKYEIRCPPGGEESVVLYSTSLGSIRKTFTDCNTVRQILQSFHLQFDERDISIHSQFRMELTSIMGGPATLPQLFIRGYHIGGADHVVRMSEESELDVLLEGIPRIVGGLRMCGACGGLKFIPCPECSGSHKVLYDDGSREDCPDCNEYGLAQCPLCVTFFGG